MKKFIYSHIKLYNIFWIKKFNKIIKNINKKKLNFKKSSFTKKNIILSKKKYFKKSKKKKWKKKILLPKSKIRKIKNMK